MREGNTALREDEKEGDGRCGQPGDNCQPNQKTSAQANELASGDGCSLQSPDVFLVTSLNKGEGWQCIRRKWGEGGREGQRQRQESSWEVDMPLPEEGQLVPVLPEPR